jgi:nucleotide-binding universal stress UspA family protein
MYRRMLVPLDGAQLDESVAAAIPQVTGSRDVEVVLVRVLEPTVSDSKEGSRRRLVNRIVAGTEEATKSMARTAVFLRAHVRRVTTILRRGSPAVEILDAAREWDVDFIVMRPSRLDGHQGGLFDPVADGVLRNAGIPVVVVPPARHVVAQQVEHDRTVVAQADAA